MSTQNVSAARSCWMRLFLWFSNTVIMLCGKAYIHTRIEYFWRVLDIHTVWQQTSGIFWIHHCIEKVILLFSNGEKFTVFENHWKSLILHFERSELCLHLEWQMPKMVFKKSKDCGQTMLPDRSILIGQKLVEKAKSSNETF